MQVMHTAFARGHSFQDVPTLPSLNLAFFLGYFLEQSYLNGLPSYAKNTDTDMLPFFFFHIVCWFGYLIRLKSLFISLLSRIKFNSKLV